LKSKLKVNLQNYNWVFYALLIIYFIFSLNTLKAFPFVHSDETWLGGLSRVQMMSSSFKVTEPFFNLYPRAPHGIKILFHLAQMPFIMIGGYNILSLRLVSFTGAVIALYFWSKLLKNSLTSPYLYLGGILLLCLNIQFFYTSHFARQEIWLVVYQLLALLWLTDKDNKHVFTKSIILGSSIFIHPNAVIIFTFIFMYSLVKILYRQPNSTKDMLKYLSFLILSIVLVIGISFLLNPNFIGDYMNFGSTLGVTKAPIQKIKDVTDYIYKIFYQHSATYYIPNLRFELILISVISIFSLKSFLQPKKDFNKLAALIMLISYCLVVIAIGRYNTTSIIFLIVPGYYLLLLELNSIKIPIQNLLILALVLFSTYSLIAQVTPWKEDNYTSYIDSIFYLTQGEPTLGNLNIDFAFKPYNLYDFRNLDHLIENDLSLEDYIRANKVMYIALPSEMDYISKNIDRWHILYGDINTYYPELIRLINEYGDHVGTINNNYYSVRILRYIGTPSWETNIYKIDLPTKTSLEQ